MGVQSEVVFVVTRECEGAAGASLIGVYRLLDEARQGAQDVYDRLEAQARNVRNYELPSLPWVRTTTQPHGCDPMWCARLHGTTFWVIPQRLDP